MCSNEGNDFVCECTAGFSGEQCETDIDECESSPCENGGSCSDAVNGFVCSCSVDFSGPTCESEVVFCREDSCLNGATCNEESGGFSCLCTPGFAGSDCSENINECDLNPCFNNATCTDTVGSFTCLCEINFTGLLCENKTDFCADAPCSSGVCIPVQGAFECQCDAGFTGSICDQNINDCDPNPCENGATCVDATNQYTCICQFGYTGLNCETDIDECTSSPCRNGGTCTDAINSFVCNCPPGFSSPQCAIQTDFCIDSPCFSGGTCSNIDGGFICECPAGWSGNQCQFPESVVIKLNSCQPENYINLIETFGVDVSDSGLLALPSNASLLQNFAFEPNNGFYFSAWIWQGETASIIFSYSSPEGSIRLSTAPVSEELTFAFTSASVDSVHTFLGVPIAPFQWHHIALSAVDSGELSLAIDSTYSNVTSFNFTSSEMLTIAIGDVQTSEQFSGIIRGAAFAPLMSDIFSLSSLTQCAVSCVNGDGYCDNGGQCLDLYGTLRTCQCPYGYTGLFCQYLHDRYDISGDGFVNVSPISSDESFSSMKLDFKTASGEGDLFTRTTRVDESTLSLGNGMLRSDINYCDSSIQSLVISSPSTLTDQQWHTVALETNQETETLTAQIDSNPPESFGIEVPVCINPPPYSLKLGPVEGCIRNIAIDNEQLDSPIVVLNGSASFGCTQDTVQFFGESYVELPNFISRESQSIALDISTLASAGIVYFSRRVPGEPTPDPRDFIAIHLEDGQVVFSFSLGEAGQEVNIRSQNTTMNDGRWHHVEAMQNGTMATLIIDGVATVAMSSGPLSLLDTTSRVFLGRVPAEERITGFSGYTNLSGCIRDLEQNGRAVNLQDNFISQNVRFGQCN